MRVLIIGTSHSYQVWPTSAPDDEAKAFDAFVRLCLSKTAFGLLAEEMSEDALKLRKGRGSVLRSLAAEQSLEHRFCDPSISEREYKQMNEPNVNLNDWREYYWLDCLLEFNAREISADLNGILFVCGANHVDSFKSKCMTKFSSVEILHPDFYDFTIHLDKKLL